MEQERKKKELPPGSYFDDDLGRDVEPTQDEWDFRKYEEKARGRYGIPPLREDIPVPWNRGGLMNFLDLRVPFEQYLFCPGCYSFNVWGMFEFPYDEGQEPLNSPVNFHLFRASRDAPHKRLLYVYCMECNHREEDETHLLKRNDLPDTYEMMSIAIEKLVGGEMALANTLAAYPTRGEEHIKLLMEKASAEIRAAEKTLLIIQEYYLALYEREKGTQQ